jgi:hypothetical protein
MIVKCPTGTVRGTFSSVVALLLRLLWCRTCLSIVRGMVWHLPVSSFSGRQIQARRVVNLHDEVDAHSHVLADDPFSRITDMVSFSFFLSGPSRYLDASRISYTRFFLASSHSTQTFCLGCEAHPRHHRHPDLFPVYIMLYPFIRESSSALLSVLKVSSGTPCCLSHCISAFIPYALSLLHCTSCSFHLSLNR